MQKSQSTMVVSKQVSLPTEAELTVQEIEVSTPGLRAASFHMGKACENVNNVRKCVEGKPFLLNFFFYRSF